MEWSGDASAVVKLWLLFVNTQCRGSVWSIPGVAAAERAEGGLCLHHPNCVHACALAEARGQVGRGHLYVSAHPFASLPVEWGGASFLRCRENTIFVKG